MLANKPHDFPGVREHRDWNVEERKKVVQSDESQFRLFNANERCEYAVRFMKPWIMHARLELFKGMVA